MKVRLKEDLTCSIYDNNCPIPTQAGDIPKSVLISTCFGQDWTFHSLLVSNFCRFKWFLGGQTYVLSAPYLVTRKLPIMYSPITRLSRNQCRTNSILWLSFVDSLVVQYFVEPTMTRLGIHNFEIISIFQENILILHQDCIEAIICHLNNDNCLRHRDLSVHLETGSLWS